MADDPIRRPRRVIGDAGAPGPLGPTPAPRPVPDAPSQPPANPAMSAPGPDEAPRVEAARAALQSKTADLEARLAVYRRALPAVADAAARELAERTAVARSAADRERSDRIAKIEAGYQRHLAEHGERVDEAAARLAPGAAGCDLVHLADQETPAAPAGYQRWGALRGLDRVVPALAPLVDHKGWYLRGDHRQAEDVALAACLRILAQAPPRHVSVQVFDPRIRGTFGRLSPVRTVNAETFPAPVAEPGVFADRVAAALRTAGRNAELAVAAGARGLTEMWRSGGVPEGSITVLVLLDYPQGVTSELQQRLEQAAGTDGATGISMLIVEDPTAKPAQDVVPERLRSRLRTVELAGDDSRAEGYPHWLRVAPDAIPDDAFSGVVARIESAVRNAQGPTIPLTEVLAEDIAQPWRHSSAESVDALIGRVRNEPLEISLRTENPPHPNLIIGGAVGQGKSNLLLDLIYSLAVRYSPEELELDLLDFKRGLEFKRFGPDDAGEGWLPHVKILSLESNHEFGVAVLQHMDDEMERRSRLFKMAGASSLDSYRRLTGQTLPRKLLVIDEFHVLFEGDERLVERAVALLALIAKQGRAYGLHMLLSSQTISGIQGLAVKGDGIFAQFPLRISLKNTATESQAILAQGNKAASELTYRGEVIVNRNFGSDPEGSNIRGIAAWAQPEAMEQVQRELWERRHGDRPMLFIGSGYAEWDDELLAAHKAAALRRPFDEGLNVWLGRPIAVTQEPRAYRIDAEADRAVAVVGPNPALATAALRSIALTASHDLGDGGEIVILDGLGQPAPWLDELRDYADSCGIDVRVIDRSEIAGYLRYELAPRLDDPDPISAVLVIGLALHRARGMTEADAPVMDDYGVIVSQGGLSARGVLQKAATQGAMAGVFLAAWWANLRTIDADLGPGRPGVGLYLTADLGTEDLRDIAGPLANGISASPRLGAYDINSDEGLTVVVPFAPDQAEEER